MPVITYPRLSLEVEDITASWGSRRERLASAHVTALLSELLAKIEAEGWVQPKASFRIWKVVDSARDWLGFEGGSRISSPALGHHLPGASHVAAGVCTIGGAIEENVRQMFASSDRLRGVMLDEIGTLMLFRLGDQLEEAMQAEAARYALDASAALSPGDDGFAIPQQAVVLELAGGADIGVSLTSSGMLVPRKSLSAVVGFGLRMPKESRAERCERCAARERCPHRWPRTSGVAA